MDSIFKSINHKVNSALRKEPTEEEAKDEEKLSLRHERKRKLIIRSLRDKFIEKKLYGSITICSSLFHTDHSVTCDINDDDYIDSNINVIMDEQLSIEDNEIFLESSEFKNKQQKEDDETFVKLAISFGERLITKLESRAQSYRKVSYKNNMTLTCTTTVSGPLGFYSIGLSCSATIKSLLKDP